MNWILANWVWLLIAVAFVAMHMFGHGGHGGHGGDAGRTSGESPGKREENRPGGHHH